MDEEDYCSECGCEFGLSECTYAECGCFPEDEDNWEDDE